MNRTKYLFKLAHDYLEFRLPVSVEFLNRNNFIFAYSVNSLRCMTMTQYMGVDCSVTSGHCGRRFELQRPQKPCCTREEQLVT